MTSVELMLAMAQDRYAAAVAYADRLAAAGQRDAVAARSSRSAALMAWCYWTVGRMDDARTILELGKEGVDLDHVRRALALDSGDAEARPMAPELTGGPLDALVLRDFWADGRLQELVDGPASPWARAVSAQWRIGALRALGRTQDALELCETYDNGVSAPAWFLAVVRPELLLDCGLVDEARDAIGHGHELVREHAGSLGDVLNRLLEAKLELRTGGSIVRAEEVLRQLEREVGPGGYVFLREQVATWVGLALLLQGRVAAAARRLRQAVSAMKSTGRALELPTAAVFLAEAESRLGHANAAAKAAACALEAADGQGSNHLLLQALAQFPAVVTRQIEFEEGGDSQWHELGRSLMAAGAPIAIGGRTRIQLAEFGQPTIEVNGVEVRARIKKSYELLAYLASRPSPEAEREELLDALFDGRADDSARSYLRQAVHRLREVLSDDAVLAFEGSRLRLGGDVLLVSDFSRLTGLLASAARRSGGERLALLLEAVALIDCGEYLAGVTSRWVDERRGELGAIAADTRHEAAQLLFAEANYLEARRLATTVLRFDPYREGTWRLLMRIAHATGDEDGVVDTYRLCERAMREIGMTVSGTTESLLGTLRR
jgi:DNA-binding SARP family transcriptional activator